VELMDGMQFALLLMLIGGLLVALDRTFRRR